MLEGLDQIDWTKLAHAYGPATDVPDQIRALTSPDEAIFDEAVYWLMNNIYHQGTIYQATSYAVPFLIELLAYDNVQWKHEIVSMLSDIARGSSYWEVHQQTVYEEYQRTKRAKLAQLLRKSQVQIQDELFWVNATHKAVAEGIQTYFNLLNSENPITRSNVIDLLIADIFEERKTNIVPELTARLEIEKDPYVRAGIVLAIGTLSVEEVVPRHFFSEFIRNQESAIVKLAASVILAHDYGKDTPQEAATILIEAVQQPESSLPFYPYTKLEAGIGMGLDGYLIFLGSGYADRALEALTSKLRDSTWQTANICKVMLIIAFEDKKVDENITFATLSDNQRAVLSKIADNSDKWEENWYLGILLRKLGLPDNPEALQRFIQQ